MADNKKTAVAKEGSKDDITSRTGDDDRQPQALRTPTSPTAIGDPSGVYTNRTDQQGTLQREPTPEELPSDAKIAPLAEQLSPNGAAQAVGALPQPTEIAGAKQPKEGEKNLVSDISDASQYLPEGSKQGDEAKRAVEDAGIDADRGRLS